MKGVVTCYIAYISPLNHVNLGSRGLVMEYHTNIRVLLDVFASCFAAFVRGGERGLPCFQFLTESRQNDLCLRTKLSS